MYLKGPRRKGTLTLQKLKEVAKVIRACPVDDGRISYTALVMLACSADYSVNGAVLLDPGISMFSLADDNNQNQLCHTVPRERLLTCAYLYHFFKSSTVDIAKLLKEKGVTVIESMVDASYQLGGGLEIRFNGNRRARITYQQQKMQKVQNIDFHLRVSFI